jgi:hypothetical protein
VDERPRAREPATRGLPLGLRCLRVDDDLVLEQEPLGAVGERGGVGGQAVGRPRPRREVQHARLALPPPVREACEQLSGDVDAELAAKELRLDVRVAGLALDRRPLGQAHPAARDADRRSARVGAVTTRESDGPEPGRPPGQAQAARPTASSQKASVSCGVGETAAWDESQERSC